MRGPSESALFKEIRVYHVCPARSFPSTFLSLSLSFSLSLSLALFIPLIRSLTLYYMYILEARVGRFTIRRTESGTEFPFDETRRDETGVAQNSRKTSQVGGGAGRKGRGG